MQNFFRSAAIALAIWAAGMCAAIAQTSPNLTYGQVLTPGQWNQLFINKQDTLGFVPLNSNGGVMLGRLVTAAPSSTTAGFNLTPGSTPSSPGNGDVWITTSGLFAQINGSTVGPYTSLATPCTGCALTANPLSQFASTTSAQLLGVLSDETGTGLAVFNNTPTLITPVLGVATATSINKVAITAPGTSATLTIANGKTLTASNSLTFTGTDATSFAFPGTSDTVVTLGATQTLTAKTLTSPTINAGALSGTITGTPNLSGNLTFSGVPLLTGLSSGTCVNAINLDSGNNIVKGACAGAAASIQVTGTSVTSSTASNYVLTTGTVSAGTGTLANVQPTNGIEISGGNLQITSARRTNPTTSDVTIGAHSGGFAANTSGTYTTPAGVLWIEGWVTGGGAGGGAGNATSAGGAGNASCWALSGAACSSPVYSGGGGAGGTGGVTTASTGGAGGAISGSSTCDIPMTGQGGEGGTVNTASVNTSGGRGGNSYRGGGSASISSGTGPSAAADSGSGGSGGPQGASVAQSGGGGGSGATCYFRINAPAGTYTYAVGSKGTGFGTPGSGGGGGGNGGDGHITVIEHYGS